MNMFKGLSSQVNERTRSPLYGSYIICWILWNWRIFVFLFFADKDQLGAISTTGYIDENYFDEYYAYLWVPLIMSIAFIYVLPLIDKAIIKYNEEQKRQKNDIKIEIAKKHPVSGEMYYTLKEQFELEKTKVVYNDIALKAVQKKMKT